MTTCAAQADSPAMSAAASDRSGSWTPWSRTTWRASAHLATDLPVGMLWGTTTLALVLASAGLMPVALLGLPLLVVALGGSQLLARAERARARALLGGLATTPPRPLPRTVRGLALILLDRRAWAETAYAIVLLPLGAVTTTLVVTGWALSLAGLTAQAWAWLLPAQSLTLGSTTIAGEPLVLLVTAGAAALTLVMPSVVRLLASLDRGLVNLMLG